MLKVQRLCFQRVMNMVHDFQMLILVVVDPSILEMVPRARPCHCPNPQPKMMLLVNSGSLCTCSLKTETDSFDAGYQFSQGTSLCDKLWRRLDPIPNAVGLLVASVLVESGFVLNATLRSAAGTFIADTVTNSSHKKRVSGVS